MVLREAAPAAWREQDQDSGDEERCCPSSVRRGPQSRDSIARGSAGWHERSDGPLLPPPPRNMNAKFPTGALEMRNLARTQGHRVLSCEAMSLRKCVEEVDLHGS
jgi:hypothetical protein